MKHLINTCHVIKIILTSGALFYSTMAFTQSERTYVEQTFRGTRVINGHSVEMLNEGELDLLISHRFGRVNGGGYELFGLDQASIRFGLEYGYKKWLNIGVGRSSYGKHYDSYIKLQLLKQSVGKGSPVSINYLGTAAINTLRPLNPNETVPIQTRPAYTHQLLIAKKFGDRFSAQLMPGMVHYNMVETRELENDVFSVGMALRYALNKNVAILGEYYYVLPGQLSRDKHNAFAIGFDINTGSHVFQLHLTNAQGMIEKAFIGETTGDWLKGDIHIGFNISRVFKLKGRRY